MSVRSFLQLFGCEPAVAAKAPGRVNLIGEHTDYNGGFVLPAAIPLETTVEISPHESGRVRVWSVAFSDEPPVTFELGAEQRTGDWADYVRGVTWALGSAGSLRGFDARIESRVPVGGGLSSSASLAIALGRALRTAFAIPLDDVGLALAARRAETDFVGAPVGIMDPLACSLADASSALLIDTRTLARTRVPLPPETALIVIDSGLRHSHAAGDYRTRRDECVRAAAALGVAELRDVDMGDLDRIGRLPEPLNRRARHVVTENARVLAAVEALRAADLEAAGRLFVASHLSMRDDFEVSVPCIDALVDAAIGAPGVYGARLTGGGFGGAIVALADRNEAPTAAAEILRRHSGRGFPPARVIVPE